MRMQPSRVLLAKQVVGDQRKLSDTSLPLIWKYLDISRPARLLRARRKFGPKKISVRISDRGLPSLEYDMDQSSHSQVHQETTEMRAAPLTCSRISGEPYTRHQAVENEIALALGMSHTAWCDRPWRLETLVHLIRLRQRDEDPHVLGVLSYQFFERVKPTVNDWSRGYGPADSEEIQIAVANELGDLLEEKPPSRTAEYLEVDAVTVVRQATLRSTGQDRPKAQAFQSADRDEDGQYTPIVERLASGELNPEEHLLAVEEEDAGGALRYLKAVTDPRHREAFILRHIYNWPLKDGPDGAPTLCEKFKPVSDRQIRNWIKTASEQMREAHGEQS